MLKAAIGVSDHIDPDQAIVAVLDQCTRELAGAVPQAGILYTSVMGIDYAPLLARVAERFPGLALIGCTTDGEIASDKGFAEDAVALLLLASDRLRFATAVATDLSQRGGDALVEAVAACRAQLGDEPSFGIVLPDGLSTISLPLDRLLRQASGDRFPFFGGTAGDHFQLQTTWQFHGERVYTDAAPLLLCSGRLHFSSQVLTGNEPIGRFYPVTKVEANILYEIDNKRATDFYAEIFGQYFDQNPAVQSPLAVYEDGRHEFYLRDNFSADKETGSVSFIGTFPDLCRIRLTSASREDILRTAHDANEAILHRHPGGQPELILLFPCTSQRHTLGTKTNDMFALLRQAKPLVPFFGFYCYGEIGPLPSDGPVFFHSDTYVIVAISERE